MYGVGSDDAVPVGVFTTVNPHEEASVNAFNVENHALTPSDAGAVAIRLQPRSSMPNHCP